MHAATRIADVRRIMAGVRGVVALVASGLAAGQCSTYLPMHASGNHRSWQCLEPCVSSGCLHVEAVECEGGGMW